MRPHRHFDAEASCPKCGHDDVAVHHKPSLHQPDCDSKVCGWVAVPECCGDEHFHRVCQRCRYLWREEVLS